MLSINRDDCLTCAIAEAKGVSYKVIYRSVKLLTTTVYSEDKEYMGMPSMSRLRAVFTNKPLVLCYETQGELGHAVAIIEGEAIDNSKCSYLENRSVLWFLWNRKVINIFKARVS
tara:strand:+ start:4152 stop:4496 length:345 start_codon:yes stop_codon:yes gene_type:complete